MQAFAVRDQKILRRCRREMNVRRVGERMVSAAIVDDVLLVFVGGQKLGFRLRDRRLVCPVWLAERGGGHVLLLL